MGSFRESFVEQAALAWLESAGSSVKNRAEIAPGEPAAERDDYRQVVLARLNPALARRGGGGRFPQADAARHSGNNRMSAPVEAPGGEVRVYEAADGEVRVDVRLDRETVWLTQEQMSQLFGRERSVITKHVRNVFRERELEPGATCAKFAQVQTEGDRTVTRDVDHYNLDVIVSVGYRVKSVHGTRFRQWATATNIPINSNMVCL